MKKVSYLFFSVLALFMVCSSVSAVSIKGCSIDADIDVRIVNAVHTIILVIQIVVPVLIVIFGSIDFAKAVVQQKEDDIKKGQQTFIKRLIAGVIVFFVVSIVKLVVSFAAGDDKPDILNCADCFLNGANANGVCNSSVKSGSQANDNNAPKTTNDNAPKDSDDTPQIETADTPQTETADTPQTETADTPRR